MTEIVPIRPSTGEIIDIVHVSTEELASARLELAQREKAFKQMRATVDAELRQRMTSQGRRVALVGDYEVRVTDSRRRVWDADDLEATLTELLQAGSLDAHEVLGIVGTETVVHGNAARELLLRTTGKVREQLDACFSWQPGRECVEVIKCPPLILEGE